MDYDSEEPEVIYNNIPVEYCYNCGAIIDQFNPRVDNECMSCKNK
jgi:hypothetical protein